MSIIKTLGIGLELFPISRLVLVLVSIEIKNQDTSWYWSQKKFHFKTCLGIGIEMKMVSRQVLVLIKKGGLAELCFKHADVILECSLSLLFHSTQPTPEDFWYWYQ